MFPSDGRHEEREHKVWIFPAMSKHIKYTILRFIKRNPCLFVFWHCRIELKSEQIFLTHILNPPPKKINYWTWAKKCNKPSGQAFTTAPFTDHFSKRGFLHFRYKAAYHVWASLFFCCLKIESRQNCTGNFHDIGRIPGWGGSTKGRRSNDQSCPCWIYRGLGGVVTAVVGVAGWTYI